MGLVAAVARSSRVNRQEDLENQWPSRSNRSILDARRRCDVNHASTSKKKGTQPIR